MHAGDSFDVTLSKAVVFAGGPETLKIAYADLAFDAGVGGPIHGAFEVALVDAQGRPIVPAFATGRDAFFNVTAGQPAAVGAGTTVDGQAVTRWTSPGWPQGRPGR